MTAPAPMRVDVASRRAPEPTTVISGTVAVIGCGLLATRPALVALTPFPVAILALVFLALLAFGVWLPLPAIPTPRTDVRATALVVLVGVVAFGGGRWLIGGRPPTTATAFLIATNTLAAFAEEAWFRRLCFGLLAPAGTAVAVVGSAVLFAAVHVSIYGLWVLPLDLAAGLVLGWQRATTGSWTAPAITHAIANVLVVL